MKRTMGLIACVLLLLALSFVTNPSEGSNNTNKGVEITVSCSPELMDLARQWADEYGKLHPGIRIRLVEAADKQEKTKPATNLCLYTDESCELLGGEPLWKIIIGRDVIVPVINSRNPLIEKILKQGIPLSGLAEIFRETQNRDWRELLGTEDHAPFHPYFVNNEKVKSRLAGFIGVDQRDLNGVMVADSRELIAAVRNDVNGAGFCRLADLQESGQGVMAEGLLLLPIDKNGNGKLDYFEKIYGDLNEFSRGVWIGKYPRVLINDIYAVSTEMPKNYEELALLRWLITGGGNALRANGYSGLAQNEIGSKLEKLNEPVLYTGTTRGSGSVARTIFIVCIILLSGSIVAGLLVRYLRKRAKVSQKSGPVQPEILKEMSLRIPSGLYYDKSHTWAFMEKNGSVRLGIDDFIQHVTGPLTRIIMRNPGESVKRNEPIITLVRNGKHVTIYAPVSGTIQEINNRLVTDPSLINSSPENEGWVYLIEPANWLRETQFLIMAGGYREWIRKEFTRLKDFLSGLEQESTHGFTPALQEGGELMDNVLRDLSPETWEDFQKNFIDTSGLR